MLSLFQRQLSLLLVVVLTMSWLVLPQSLKAQYTGSTLTVEAAQGRYRLKNGYQFAYTNNPANPTSIEFSWNQPNTDSLIDKSWRILPDVFQYIDHYEIQFLPNSLLKSGGMTDEICKKGVWAKLATVDEAASQKTRTVRTVDNARSKIDEPSYFRLLATSRPGELIIPPVVLACGTATISPYTADNPTIGQSAGGATTADATNSAIEGVKQIFGYIRFVSDSDRDLALVDDPSVAQEEFPSKPPIVIIKKEAISRDTQLPSPPSDVVFQLNATLSAQNYTILTFRQSFADNNFFVFKLLNSGPNVEYYQKYLKNPDIVYLIVDLTGNVMFLVDDKSRAGGIFTPNADRHSLDEFRAVGKSSNNNTEESKNLVGKLLRIPKTEYANILTKRVYNEPVIQNSEADTTGNTSTIDETGEETVDVNNSDTSSSTSQTGYCDASPEGIIEYKETNSRYDLKDENDKFRFAYGLPDPDHARCINLSNTGWLATWGVIRGELDIDNDACSNAFKVGIFTKFLIVKPICGALSLIIGGAVAFANYSVSFLLDAVGLQ